MKKKFQMIKKALEESKGLKGYEVIEEVRNGVIISTRFNLSIIHLDEIREELKMILDEIYKEETYDILEPTFACEDGKENETKSYVDCVLISSKKL